MSRAELSASAGVAANIHYGDVLIKFGEYLDMRKETFPWIEKQTDADKFRTSFLQDGDVVFADTAENETAGKCCEIRNCGSMVIISGLHTIPCRPESKFASGYLGYYLNSTAFHEQLVLKESERPSSLVAQAVSYALNIEEELKKFLKDSRLNIVPALNKARERGKSISCLSNQKQVGIQFMTYTGDFKGSYPHYQIGNTIVDSSIKNSGSDCSNMWHFVLSWLYARPLKSTTLVKSIFACPSHTPDRMALMYISYGYNFANIGSSHRVDGTQTPAKDSRIRNVANVVLTAETQRCAMVGTSRSKRGYFLCKDTFTNTSSSDYTVSARHEPESVNFC